MAGVLYQGHYLTLNEMCSSGGGLLKIVLDELNMHGNLPFKSLSIKKSVMGASSNEEYEKLINFRGTEVVAHQVSKVG